MDVGIVDAVIAQQLYKLLWVQLAHQISADPVVTLCQTPLQRNHLSIARMVGVAGCPASACNDIGLLTVGRHVAGGESVLHRQTVEEWLDGGTHLSASQAHHVVHEVCIVETAHIGFHGSRLGIHAHEARTQETLVVAYGVERTHQGVDVAMIGKDGHLHLLSEGVVYLLGRIACRLHGAVALALGDGSVQDGAYLIGRQLVGEGSTGLGLVLTVEGGLQIACHMLVDCLLGIFLHTAVYRGEHSQTVGIDVIGGAVLLEVLVAPAIEGICVPGYRVDDKLHSVPRRIVGAHGALGGHILAEELAQIGGCAVLMVGTVEVEGKGFGRILGILRAVHIACLHHLLQHHVSSFPAAVGIAHGVEERGVLAESDEGGCLAHRQVFGLFVEVSVGCGLDAHRIVQEVEVVEIEGDDLLLGVIALQLDGYHPLYGFLEEALHGAAGCLAIQLLRQLLGDGGASSGIGLSHDSSLHDGSAQGTEVDA